MSDSTKTRRDPETSELEDKDIGGGPDADALEGAFALPEEEPVDADGDAIEEDDDEEDAEDEPSVNAWDAI